MRRIVASYLDSIRNEISIDTHLYDLLSILPKDYGYIPRPTRATLLFKGRRSFILKFRFGFPFLWLAIGPLLYFYKLLIYSFKKAKVFFSEIESVDSIKNNSSLFMLFSTRALSVFESSGIKVKSRLFITVPWIPLEVPGKAVCIIKCLSCKTILLAYIYSIISLFFIFKQGRLRFWILQSYTAFEWFLVFFTLRELKNKDFYCAEHYDRWAVLLDKVVCENREFGDDSLSLTIFQHGFLGGLSIKQGGSLSKLIIPYRLCGVSSIWVYDAQSKNYFYENILDVNLAAKGIACAYFSPGLVLSDVGSDHVNDMAKILIIGNTICDDFHLELLNHLKFINIVIYYKPHPLNPASVKIRDQSWLFIKNPQFFPKVDLVVTYPSTLELEYKLNGIGSIMHSLDEPVKSAEGFARDISDFLTNKGFKV